ncbi:hypothetical protein FHETE_9129 [Fusarium heterosporum]|uniref:Uncharacterized protein n=1 Tax=Fusarium heterosporum TaxID=42747 RepID=A0A8H5SZU3_FUSHE|nr:hypothetical protein FHETE_9129 [Fusarium heterosporum]
MAPSDSTSDAANSMPVLGLKRETFAASTDHRIMLEEFGRKYYNLGFEAGHASGIEAGLTQAEEEVELRIATATEESRKCIHDLLEKGNHEANVDVSLAKETRDILHSVVSEVGEVIHLPGLPLDTYANLREKCEYLSVIRNKLGKRLGDDVHPVSPRKRRSEPNTPSKKVKREKKN